MKQKGFSMRDRKQAAKFLGECYDHPDPRMFRSGLKFIVDADGGVDNVARRAGLKRDTVERMLSWNGVLGLNEILPLLKAVGLKIVVNNA